jgi:hypothetical protein
MSEFKIFADAVNKALNDLQNTTTLYVVNTRKKEVFNKYLSLFPDGTDKVSERTGNTHHQCNCCSHFIRDVGNVVAISDDLSITTIWGDLDLPYPYDVVAKGLDEFIKTKAIKGVFLLNTNKVGEKSNIQTTFGFEQTPLPTAIKWHHFYGVVKSRYISQEISTKQAEAASSVQVIKRVLTEFSIDVAEYILELIQDPTQPLYRGEEFKPLVKEFILNKQLYDSVPLELKNTYIWAGKANKLRGLRNSPIGKLIENITQGVDKQKAIYKYLDMVAPDNYQRPKNIAITQSMLEKHIKLIDNLGLTHSLGRQHASLQDMSLKDIYFGSQTHIDTFKDTNPLMDVLKSVVTHKTSTKGALHIGIEEFFNEVLPNIDTMELLLTNDITNNLVNITKNSNPDSKNIFKWDNPFAISYINNTADANPIKDLVEKRGGDVNAHLRVSLAWETRSDLDISVNTPNMGHIGFSSKQGVLDIDANFNHIVTDPVENLRWSKNQLATGDYPIHVNNYSIREGGNSFTIQVEFKGEITNYTYPLNLTTRVDAFTLKYNKKKDTIRIVKLDKRFTSDAVAKEIWGLKTNTFIPVTMATLSPNYWGFDKGNKHYLFMLEGCRNPDPVRGIYNEFLVDTLRTARKSLELLANKTMCEYSDNQLAGVGFSSTVDNTITVKTKGDLSRTYIIKFGGIQNA